MIAETLMALISQVQGTPYISGGDSPRGTDCSGLASWVANAATGRPVYGDRFNTGNQERALLARGFKYGSEPGALVIGWNGGHTAVTLPDGTSVSSGEGGGVRVGGGGAYQKQFTKHMYLPIEQLDPAAAEPPADPMLPPPPPEANIVQADLTLPPPPLPDPAMVPADAMLPPAPEPPAPEAPAVIPADATLPAPDMAPADAPPVGI